MKQLSFLLLLSIVSFISCNKGAKNEMNPFYFRNGNADLWVNIEGNINSDVFVIYLHGGPGQGSNVYNQGLYAGKMEEDYAMVYLDQRGNGVSQGSYSREELTVEQISDDIYQLVLFLKAQYGTNISIFLSGHSWGGLTAAHTLIETNIQEEIKGWIQIDGVHDINQNEIEVVKMLRGSAIEEIAKGNEIDFWQAVLERVNQIDTLNVTIDDGSYLNSTAFDAQKKFDLIITESSSAYTSSSYGSASTALPIKMSNASGLVMLNIDSETYQLHARLNEIEIPSLLLWGKYDFVVPPSMGQIAYDSVNTTEKELVIFNTSGHNPMVNEGERMTQLVKEFIEKYR